MDKITIKRLLDRAEKGKRVYGHGVQPKDDTRQWGTMTNDWFEMAEEELLDAIMYISADYHREYLPDTPEVPINKDMLECELSGLHSELMEKVYEMILICQRRKKSPTPSSNSDKD